MTAKPYSSHELQLPEHPGAWRGEGPAVLRLRLREVELSLATRKLADDARSDAQTLMKALRREALIRPHASMTDLAAKLRLIAEGGSATTGHPATCYSSASGIASFAV